MKEITYNFGVLKEAVAKLASAEVLKQETSKTLEKFNKELNENIILKKQFLLFKNIQTAKPFDKERLAERFVLQNLRMFNGVSWEELIRENKRVRREMTDNMHVESKDNTELFESIHTLLESQCNVNFNNFEKEQQAYEFVLSYLTRKNLDEGLNEKEDNPKLNKFWQFLTQFAVNNFESRYEHLNESERKLLKVLIMEDKLKNDYLNTLISECIEEIKIKKDSNSDDNKVIDLLNNFETKLNSIQESDNKNVDEAILYCFELKENL